MYRLLFGLVAGTVFAAALLCPAGEVLAQSAESFPALPLDAKNWRGHPADGWGYLSLVKILLTVAVFLLWVRTTDWASRDMQELKLDYVRWSPIVFGPFLAAMILLWLLPWFVVGFVLLLTAYTGPLVAYFVYRKPRAAQRPDESLESLCNLLGLLTADAAFLPMVVGAFFVNWGVVSAIASGLPCGLYLVLPIATLLVLPRSYETVGEWASTRFLKYLGREKKDVHETGPPVKVTARGGATPRDDSIHLLAARQHPGLRAAREILAAGLSGRASAIMLEYTPQSVAVRYMLDGVWLPQNPLQREAADPALEALKTLCGLNPQDRQSKQEGKFGVEFEGQTPPLSCPATLACQGVQTGERVVIQFEEKKVRFENLEALGMRPKMQEQLQELLDRPKGLLVFSALPANGLRTTFTLAMRNTDRLMREFAAVEDEGRRYEEIENVPVTTYNAAGGENPATVLPRVLRTDPNVVLVRDLVNAETVGLLCREVAPDKLAITTVRAKEAAEALLRILALGVPPADLAKAVSGVLYQRLVRKLCETCREAYAPTPEQLKQLGIPEGRVQAFYRPPTPQPDKPQKPCPKCGGIGYFGRTAIYELLVVGDNIRKVLAGTPKLDLLRAAARKDGMRLLQEEGVLLVAKGITSLPELMRVLKQ